MKKLLLLCTMFISLSLCFAAVKPGENLLINGIFDSDEIDQATGLVAKAPVFWSPTGFTKAIEYKPKGTPDGKGAIRFFSPDPTVKTGEVTIRQGDLKLVTGETYRFSALVRTVDFVSPHCGITVYNNGWMHEVGLTQFPKNQDWTRMSQEFTLIPTQNNFYACAIFACDYQGSIEIADVKLEAVSPKALAGSSVSEGMSNMRAPRLIPWNPLLNAIPLPHDKKQAPEMTFMFYGSLPNNTKAEDYDLCYSINGGKTYGMTLKNSLNTIAIKDLNKAGDFDLTVSIVDGKSGKVIYERKHVATLVELPAVSAAGHRRLNNLVVEILNQPIRKTAGEQTFQFCTLRNGWIFIAAQGAAAEGLQIVLDGKLTIINAKTDRLESFRDVAMGGHTLTVKGAVNGGNLIVRSIPEIYNYCPGVNSGVNTNKPYDWEFQKKYVYPAVTTQNGGNIPPEHRKEVYDAGYKWIANANTTRLSAEALLKVLDTCGGMVDPVYQGVSCDEQFFNDLSTILPYTSGLKQFKPKNDHVIYTWITSEPGMNGIHHDFMAECLNACHGNGRMISEVYCRSCPTEKAAREYLDNVIVNRTHVYKNFYPNVINKWGIILGNFNQVPILSLAHHPNVDYKYYLDLQFNLIANHPECQDMGITGYWGSYYADHELHRWSFLLTRHYCVEGKKTMLSDEYGFSYDPAHLKNGDFTPNFDNWTVSGNITSGKHENYGSRGQNRWGGNNNLGDTFAVFTKKDAEVSSVSQVIKGLKPGKAYCLQFFTADYNDVCNDKIAPREYGLHATLGDGAEIDKDASWLFVDKRVNGRYAHNNGVARGNLHHIVFRATKPEVTVTIDNAKAAKGEALCVNYVMVNPYLEEK